jgi:hypothetical protein
MTLLGKLQKREDFRWEIKDMNSNTEFLIDPSKGPLLKESDEGSMFEYYLHTIAIGQDQFTVTGIDVAVLKRRAS